MPRGVSPYDTAAVQARLWTPAQLPSTSLFYWFDSADMSTMDIVATAVSTWRDKSGNGVVLSQATGSRRPFYISPDLGYGVNFTIGTKLLYGTVAQSVFPSSWLGNGITLFAVIRPDALNTGRIWFGESPNGGGSARGLALRQDATTASRTAMLSVNDAATSVAISCGVTGTLAVGEVDLIVMSQISGAMRSYKNDDLTTTLTPATATPAAPYTLQGCCMGASTTDGATVSSNTGVAGVIFEIVVVAGIDPQLRQTIAGYLAAKWNALRGPGTIPLYAPDNYVNWPPEIGA